MSTDRTFRVATIGDINIDHVVDISRLQVPFSMALSGCVFRSIKTSVGGNGVFFAEAAKEAGFQYSYLFSCVGNDPVLKANPDLAAQIAFEHLQATGVEPVVSFDAERSTGQVLILYQPDDNRFMIADRGANAGFVTGNLPKGLGAILEQIDLLHISGYCFLDPVQREAVQYIMSVAREIGVFVSVDIVPHDIYQSISFETLKKFTSLSQSVSAEAVTILGFLGIQRGNLPTVDFRDQLAEALLESYELCLIRLNGRSDFLLADQKSQLDIFIPYTSRSASLRFTDRVLANTLIEYLKNERTLIYSEKWLDRIIKLTSA
jgi:sugar/nucleoside kinase (ribokinase family)